MPKHGDERNHHAEVKHGEPVTYRDARTGEVIYQGPVSSSSCTVHERYCGHCETWVRVAGVLGFIKFCAEHDDGACMHSAQPNADSAR
jgi:hypothetical protein